MNVRLSAEFGQSYLRIPLTASPNIRQADALEIDWADVLPPDRCSYLFGNPPFGGFVQRDNARQKQMANIGKLGASGNRLDYVTAWFLKAGEYAPPSGVKIAFVATNSITQGEQVSQLWPTLFERYGLEISFAHRTFEWLSDARGRAHVHCVIVGLVKHADEPVMKRLFSYDDIVGDPVESRHAALSPYLFDATGLSNRHLVVGRSRDPGSGMPLIRVGSKPVDGGYFIMDSAERAVILQVAPNAASLIRPYVGSNELINGGDRWLLTPHGVSPAQLRAMPAVMALVDKVRRYRSGELTRATIRKERTISQAPYPLCLQKLQRSFTLRFYRRRRSWQFPKLARRAANISRLLGWNHLLFPATSCLWR